MSRVASFPASLCCAPGARSRRAAGATAAASESSLPVSLTSSTTACSTSCSSLSSLSRRYPDLRSSTFRSTGKRPSSVVATRALAPDAPPDWTLDQIAGLVFGLGMMASFLLAYKVDDAVARQQRKDLGLCEACGGLNEKRSCQEKGCPMK